MTRVGVIVGNRYYTSEQLNRRMVYLRVRRDYVEAFKKDLKCDLKRRVNQLQLVRLPVFVLEGKLGLVV